MSVDLPDNGVRGRPRRALLVGIDRYDADDVPNLASCVADATAMCELLERNEDGSCNFDCRLLVSSEGKITRKVLRSEWNKLFDFRGDVVFYFSGHGAPLRSGGYLVTQEGDPDDPGLAMDELLILANGSMASSVLLILDCCNSGYLGNAANPRAVGYNQTQIREGLTILAASMPSEPAYELDNSGIFTRLLLGALTGGAADVRGLVSAASIYSYVEQALGSWEQRPLYKTYADRLPPVRICRPAVPDSLLNELPTLFPTPESKLSMDPSHEFSEPAKKKKKKNVGLFNKFKILRDARLLVTEDGDELYFTALKSGSVLLTPLGQFYWKLAKDNRI